MFLKITYIFAFFPEGIMNNPWTGDLDKYLFYCCPECDERSISKDIFIGHALTHHPQVSSVRNLQ